MKILFGSIFLSLSLCCCSSHNAEDLRYQGELEVKRLVKDLRQIETKDDLQKALPKIRERFNRIANVLVEIRKFPLPGSVEPTEASEELFIELCRLYEIPGGRHLIEMAQQDAVSKLSD